MNLKRITINTALPQKPKGRILIIYTGGTFGMTWDKQGVLIPFDFGLILEHLPTLKTLALELTVVSFETPIDSSNMNPGHWQVLGKIIAQNYETHDGFVVLHGTDTMAFTASALSFMLENLAKPVIFTGAQLPITEPRSDARENLITALDIASATKDGKPLVPEVCIYFDYELLRGNRAKKTQSMQFDAFDSGNYPLLAKAGVTIDYNYAFIRKAGTGQLHLRSAFDNNISILKLFPGIGKATVDSVLDTPGLKGVVLETFGSGNAPTLPFLVDALRDAIQRGVVIVNISQCPGGTVIQGRYATSTELVNVGVLSGGDMTTEAAVTKLMLMLGECPEDKDWLVKPVAGELSE